MRGKSGDHIPMSTNPTPLYDQWKKKIAERHNQERPVPVEMPSGVQVMAVRPHLLWMLRNGRIPDALAPRVDHLLELSKAGGEDAVRVAMNDNPEDPESFYAAWIKIRDLVWLEAVKDPVFVAADRTPGEMELSILDVTEDDKDYMFIWCQGVDQSLAEFLDGKRREAEALALLQTGKEIRDGSAGVAGDRSGPGVVVSPSGPGSD